MILLIPINPKLVRQCKSYNWSGILDVLADKKETGPLFEVKVQLKDAQFVSLLNSMKRLRDIEARGNVKVDRQTGRISTVRPIDFLPEAPPKEKGPFKVQCKSVLVQRNSKGYAKGIPKGFKRYQCEFLYKAP